MRTKSPLLLTMLCVALGDAAPAIAQSVSNDTTLPAENAGSVAASSAASDSVPEAVTAAEPAPAPVSGPVSVTAPESAAATESVPVERSAESIARQSLPGSVGPSETDLIESLNDYDQTLARSPNNIPAREGRLLAMSQLGLPSEALAEAKQYPQIGEAVLQRLHEDEAALVIRQTETAYYQPGEEIPAYDKAILLTQENLQRYPGSVRSRFDMVRAMNNRKRYADAVYIYEDLEVDKIAIPGYVNEAAGSAYLAQKKPERAEQAYREALSENPNSPRSNLGLFYALVEQSKFEAAQMHIDIYAAKPMPSPAKFEAANAAIFERAYENRLEVAQEGFQTLQAEAPASDQLRLALAKIYLWRGWPRLAKQEYEMVERRDPENLAAQGGLVEVEVALGDYQSAAERLGPMQKNLPDESDVKELLRANRVRDYNELSIFASGSRSRENLGNGHGAIVESKLTGKPIGYQTRPFIHEYFERGISNDVTFDYRRLGLGLEHTIANLGVVQAEIQQEFFRHKKTSVSAGGKFALNDYWEVRGTADSNSLAVPLVARYYGISGWSAGAGATWRANEKLALQVDYSYLNMSDGNKRNEVTVQGAATLIQGPVYKGVLGLEFSAGTNSLDNVAYFNPRNAHTEQVSFTSDWLAYQRYSRTFSNRLVLSIGRYTEKNFPASNIGGVSYEARVDLSQTVSFSASIGYVRRVYSGEKSSGPEANIGFNWKFL
jgi:biofilm PGA synthesis protein PgaA